MIHTLRFAIWNANDLIKLWQTIQIFVINKNIITMLVSETNCISNICYIRKYIIYNTQYPDQMTNARVLLSKIKPYELIGYREIMFKHRISSWIMLIYSTRKLIIKKKQFWRFYETLHNQLIGLQIREKCQMFFCVTKCLHWNYLDLGINLELFSDH